jgi:hypothetical protein
MHKSIAFFSIFLLSSFNAFALGPIPNGTYVGKITCSAPSTRPFDMDVKIVVTNDTMDSELDGEVNRKRFVPAGGAKFRVNPGQENGQGYFTADGLVYEMQINGTLGRDEFRYRNGVLEESGSAVYDGETFLCRGSHRKQ